MLCPPCCPHVAAALSGDSWFLWPMPCHLGVAVLSPPVRVCAEVDTREGQSEPGPRESHWAVAGTGVKRARTSRPPQEPGKYSGCGL